MASVKQATLFVLIFVALILVPYGLGSLLIAFGFTPDGWTFHPYERWYLGFMMIFAAGILGGLSHFAACALLRKPL